MSDTRPAAPQSIPKFSGGVFFGAVLFAAVYVNHTAGDLPPLVAVHFDAAGQATSFIAKDRYRLFILLSATALPMALVAVMTFAYSRATDFKLPNRTYWLAPQRIARTRSFIVAHGIWFGSLLTGLMCFMHWLILDANRQQPPQLSNQSLLIGLLLLLACMAAWIGTLMVAFRRPGGG